MDRPAPDERADDAGQADSIDENGRDDMNGRAGVSGFTTAGEPGPAGNAVEGRRRDQAETTAAEPAEPAAEPRRQATGWASVPTSKHPVVSPTSGAPTSGAPVSPGFGGGAYGQPPTYVPALPDPAAGPVSGVPAPRAAAGLSALGDAPAKPAAEPRPAPIVASAPPAPAAPAPAAPAPAETEQLPEVLRVADGARRAWDDDLAPRAARAAPLGQPRGRRAGPPRPSRRPRRRRGRRRAAPGGAGAPR